MVDKVWKLENIPLKSEDGTVRGRRCNIIGFYCPICDQVHTQERKDTYVIEIDEGTFMICKEAYEQFVKEKINE